jgi:hypothetical protein
VDQFLFVLYTCSDTVHARVPPNPSIGYTDPPVSDPKRRRPQSKKCVVHASSGVGRLKENLKVPCSGRMMIQKCITGTAPWSALLMPIRFNLNPYSKHPCPLCCRGGALLQKKKLRPAAKSKRGL